MNTNKTAETEVTLTDEGGTSFLVRIANPDEHLKQRITRLDGQPIADGYYELSVKGKRPFTLCVREGFWFGAPNPQSGWR